MRRPLRRSILNMIGVVRFPGPWARAVVFAVAAGCQPAPASKLLVAPVQAPRALAPAPSASVTAEVANAPATVAKAPVAPIDVATRVPASVGQAHSVRPYSIVVGERWGCARVSWEGAAAWQCWNASATASGPPRAFRVPWLDGKSTLLTGPARLCAYEKPALTLRCWRPPVAGQAAVELSGSDEWLNPHQAPFEDIGRPDWAAEVQLGGAFTCYRNPSGNVWCLGDDTFGQLATASVKPSSDPHRPPFIPVWPAQNLAIGSFHGCAIAAPGGLAQGGFISCWGRGDAGQLGMPAPDVCVVDGVPVACAKTPQKGPPIPTPVLFMTAGDLFTCVSDPDGVRCWGGSRDGFFGAPGSCPKALTQHWPTLGAPVAAPKARCSQAAVALPEAHDFDQDMSAGPRGLCFVSGGKLHCLGGVPTPREPFDFASVSPGQDASACSVKDGAVRCWGEAYSSPKARAVPVTIALEPPPTVPDVAVVGSTDVAGWDGDCLVRRGCGVVPIAVPACAAAIHVRDWAEVLASARAVVGKAVQVRGPLGVAPVGITLAGCMGREGRGCCNHSGGAVVLGGASQPLLLEGLSCSGDDSQVCCNAPAFGQSVVAQGELALAKEAGTSPSYRLTNVTLCAEAGAPR